jgi:hypothetical protein
MRGLRLRRHRLSLAVRLAMGARRVGTEVIVHGGSDVFAVALVLRLLRARTRLVAVDFLMPAGTRAAALQRWALDRVDAWVCIRRGDIATLTTRYRVDPSRCGFAHFPPTFDPETLPSADGEHAAAPYVFASGSAHRDWATLLDALTAVPCDAIVAAEPHRLPPGFRTTRDRIQIIEHVSPEDGRRLARAAALVVVPMSDTELPAGPSVLVDAMALGKPIVASDTRGTRDYVHDRVDAWMVPPGDPDALAAAIGAVLADPALAARMGAAARATVLTECTASAFVRAIAAACTPNRAGGSSAGYKQGPQPRRDHGDRQL